MGPPKDRLAAMQQAAYFEDGDDYGVQMQEAMDGKFSTKLRKLYRFFNIYFCGNYIGINNNNSKITSLILMYYLN